MSHEPPSPSASSVLLPFLTARSRRGSLASITSRRELDRDALAEALDHIHGTASKSDTLTSFHDFDGGVGKGGPGTKDLVSSGMSSLYNKLKSSVGQGSSPRASARPNSRSGSGATPAPMRQERGKETTQTWTKQSPLGNGAAMPFSSTNQHINTTQQRAQNRLAESSSDSEEPQRRIGSTKHSPVPKANQRSEVPSVASNRPGPGTVPDALTPDAPARVLQYNERRSPATTSLSQNLLPKAAGESGQPLSRTSSRLTTNSASSTATQPSLKRPAMVHVGVSHLPGFQPSEVSSPANEEPPTMPLARLLSGQSLEPSPNINSALQRRRTGLKSDNTSTRSAGLPTHLKRRVISKEFWMKDENAKVCFDCGQSFSTFRRKHHCRTCGQIFDAKCTSLVAGAPFGQTGTLRLCKPCEDIIFGSNDDDSSFYSEDAEDAARRHSLIFEEDMTPPNGIDLATLEEAGSATPTIGIPASRRNREAKRRSAVIEFDAQPSLARPTSSRSLISLTGRPRSASHKRHTSRAQQFRTSKSPEDDVPFPQPRDDASIARRTSLSVFHNDNIIDPDLAAYLSDEDSEEDPQPNIASALDGEADSATGAREKLGFTSLLSPVDRRSRFSKSGPRDDDAQSIMSKATSRLGRRGTPSISSLNAFRASPRHSRSNRYLRESQLDERLGIYGASPPAHISDCLMMDRSANFKTCTAHSFDITQASYEHVRKMLVQMLADAKVEHISVWEKALMPMLLRCTSDVNPDVPRGDDMDIRHYIKLKKVPGGRPGDTSYVSGVAFSKQIALKSMARSIRNPRIAIVTFPIEYARHQSHFMSLEPVIAQEREYLQNLVSRIAALRPQVLLVQRNVSGIALKMLEEAGITVAFNIKESVLAAVARMTKTTMLKSIDKLGIDPHHLGHCEGFSVKTYVHGGARRNYIVISGCQPDLGCTIILRGADIAILRTIKRVTEFMCFVVYNLKLETHLMRDEFASIPAGLVDQLAPTQLLGKTSTLLRTLSNSNGASQSEYAAMEKRAQSRLLSASPFVVFMQPHLLTQLRATEQKMADFAQLRKMYAAIDDKPEETEKPVEHFELVEPEMVRNLPQDDQPQAVRDYLYAVHKAQYDRTATTFESQRKLWQAFLANNVDPFDPLSHQTIVVLHSTVSNATSAPCVGPELLGIGFYAGFNRADPDLEEDCTLGQYIEDVCLGAGNTCKDCSRKLVDHYRQYVHGNGQLSISVARQSSRLPGMNNVILMWSTCKICQAETSVLPMSDNTWKYSFAKYLELSFWSRPLQPRANVCEHDLHKDFVRCFGYQDLVVKVQYDPIEIYDIVVPRPTIAWNVESDLNVKNAQYQLFEKRLNGFIESVRKRLSTINVDTLDEKQMIQAQETIETLRQRADQDHHELLAKLQGKYSCSRYYELTPLNRALRFMDEKALSWDETFNTFEKDYFPSETDIRKLAAAQLKEMFYGSQSTTESMLSDLSDDEGGSELATLPPRPTSQQTNDTSVIDEKADHALADIASNERSTGSNGEMLDNDAKHDKEPGGELADGTLKQPSSQDAPAVVSALSSAAIDEKATKQSSELGQNATDDTPLSTGEALTNELGLAKRVEQIREGRDGARGLISSTSDTKIPRLQSSRIKGDLANGVADHSAARTQSQPPRPHPTSAKSTDRSQKTQADAEPLTLERRLQERIGRLSSKLSAFPPSLIPRSIPAKSDGGPTSTVSALAKHFEHLSREFEKERLRERRLRAARSRQARANPLASSRPVVEVYKNAVDAVGEPKHDSRDKDKNTPQDHISTSQLTANSSTQQDSKSIEAQHSPSASFSQVDAPKAATKELSQSVEDTHHNEGSQIDSQADTMAVLSVSGDSELDLHPDLTIPDHKRNVWFKVLAEFWSKRSASGWANLEYPLHSTEHVFEDSDIIVREDEPSSVIALSLSSADYLSKVRDFRSSVTSSRKHDQQAQADDSEIEEAIEASLLKDTGTHMKYSFCHGQVKASCKIFYAEAFDALRRRCGVANRFVESMSRCMKFDSKGGKTKSLFLKSLDNRFIIKSLQEVEVKAFTKFAPDYFAFMSHTLFRGLPSVIAKMFGLFQVTVKNPATGMEFNYYLLVMENLFYDHTPNRRFDLKGSMRNRKIESTGQPDEVLLDENLVETIFESPLFVREHSRRLLQASVWNDTLWLCKQNVMDYSLMAGFDDNARQLVVGIIDCIRTYTWDKKLESWIKDRGKNKPTITSPKDYRNRFRVSMMQYVLQAPNCWHQFQASMAPPKTLKEKDDAVPE